MTNTIAITDPKTLAKKLLNEYITKELVADFTQIPIYVKLELLQKTPKRFIEERQIADKTIHYIRHQYSKQCLNFAFNFGVSNEVINEQYHEYDEEYKKNVKDKATGKMKWVNDIRHVLEAECTVKFTFNWDDGRQTIRTVHSSHKQYKNSAICRGDAMQAAISKAWTKAAATFGIGADLEDDFYVKSKPQEVIEDEVIDLEVVSQSVTKSFAPGF